MLPKGGLVILQSLKEKKWWLPLCVAVLTVAAVVVSLVLLYAPREDAPPEERETLQTAAVTSSPRPTPPPTPTPEPPPTPTPVITPPAQSAASGSDVILTHVPPTSDSDLIAGFEPDPEDSPKTDE